MLKMKILFKKRDWFVRETLDQHRQAASWLLLRLNIKSTLNFNWKLADTKRLKFLDDFNSLTLLMHRKQYNFRIFFCLFFFSLSQMCCIFSIKFLFFLKRNSFDRIIQLIKIYLVSLSINNAILWMWFSLSFFDRN